MPDISLPNEKELLIQVSESSQSAFTEIFNFYRRKIYTTGIHLTHSEELAEELVQDVFLKIWMKREQLSEIENFNAHLFVVTRNAAFNILKKIAREKKQKTLLKPGEDSVDNADHTLLDHNYRKVLQQAVDRLPPQQKKVFLMNQEGLKREEIAERLGIQPFTVKENLARARKTVRAYCMANLDLYIRIIWLTIPAILETQSV